MAQGKAKCVWATMEDVGVLLLLENVVAFAGMVLSMFALSLTTSCAVKTLACLARVGKVSAGRVAPDLSPLDTHP
jgi:hypothetical protein